MGFLFYLCKVIKSKAIMKKLEVKTRKGGNEPKFNQNVDSVTTFLNNSDDRITVINGDNVNIEIYKDGVPLFIGDKYELFQLLIDIKDMADDIDADIQGGHISEDNSDMAFENYEEFANKYKS